MAQTLPNGTVVPNADGGEQISSTGIQEMRTLGASVDTLLGVKADTAYVDDEITANRWYRGELPSGSLGAVFAPGQYYLAAGNTYTDGPPAFTSGNSAILTVAKGSTSWGSQTVSVYGTAQYEARRTSSALGVWGTVWSEDSIPSRDAALKHDLRVKELKRRRGGVIGLGGQGAVTFRFDHHYQDWKTKILPLMLQHQIVGTMAMVGTPEGGSGIGTAPYAWEDLQATHINDGLEIMCHSYSHGGADSANDMEREIVWARDTWLTSRMPQVLVEGWMQPGAVFGAMGSSIGSPDKLWGTLAGKMLMANYALVSGHRDGYYQQLTGDVDAGLTHVTIEGETTAAPVKAIIDKAAATKTGVIFMMHPNVIGTSGHMSTAVLGEIFAYVAQLRAAGKLQNVTAGGLALADSLSDRREDLAINGSFTDGLADWTAGAGWTAENGRALSPLTNVAIEQREHISRRAVLAGSPRELVVTARGVGGSGYLTVSVADITANTALNTQRTFTFPAGDFTTQRLFFTIPYWRESMGSVLPQISLQWSLASVGERRVEIESVQVRSV